MRLATGLLLAAVPLLAVLGAVMTLNELLTNNDDLTVITQPWTGTDRSTATVPRPDEQDPEEADYDLVPAPGAVVIVEPDATTITGVG